MSQGKQARRQPPASAERPPHPADARAMLRDYAERRQAAQAQVASIAAELPQLVATCKAAGLPMTEIAQLAGVSRDTAHRAAQPDPS
jgi:DNA-directed RNA polymerase specialized sigma24 family protein